MIARTSPSWARVDGPLVPYAGGFWVELERLGYTPLTAATHVGLMAHLSRWLAREGAEASGLTPALVEAYFAERRAAGYAGHITGRALRPLLGYLRRLGVVPSEAPAAAASAEERLLARYREYLLVERGLTETTADLNARMVRPFLAGRATAEGGLDLGNVTAGQVAAFVVTQSRQQPQSVKRMVTALRSLLGFLHVEGLIGQPLAARCPRRPGWTLAGLPKALEPATGGRAAGLLRPRTPDRAAGLRRSSPCWPGSGCAPARSPRCGWMTSTGGAARSRSAAREAGTTGCRCQPMSARRSSTTCTTGGPPAAAGPVGVRPRAGPAPGADLRRGHHGRAPRGAAGRPGPDRRAPAAAHRGHRDAARRRRR